MTRFEARQQALELSAFVLKRMAFDNPANLLLPNEVALIAEEMMKIATTLEAQKNAQTDRDLFEELCNNSGRF